MLNNKYILFLIFVVTLINLFYKQWLSPTKISSLLTRPSWISITSSSTCPLYGFKCPTDEMCDCQKICGSEHYVPFRVLSNDPIYLMDQHLEPGTYCLPKGIGECHQKTSYHVFSSSGWTCIPRNKSIYEHPCYSGDAKDNTQNILWDHLRNRAAETIENPYEMLEDGSMRFRCKCDSEDYRGNAMVNTLPFVCSTDYCLREIPNPLPMMKFNHSKCDCGPYFHKTDDEASPCVVERTRLEANGNFVGRVDCVSKDSWRKNPLFCPHDEMALNFTSRVKFSASFEKFVSEALQ